VTLVDVAHVRCTRTVQAKAEEERSALPTLVLPRRGVFRYQDSRHATVADANTLLFFHPDQPYRISHPADHGDECVALRFDLDAATDALRFASEAAQVWILGAAAQRAVHAYGTSPSSFRSKTGRPSG